MLRLSFFGLINLYLLPDPRGPLLVDTGMPGMQPWLLRQLRRRGLGVDDLSGVILTHFHVDHAGTAAWFQARGVPVYAHRDEVPVLAGERPHPGYGGGPGRLLHAAERALGLTVRLSGVHPLGPGEPVGRTGWRVVSAPGHTPGSLALWHGATGRLLSGDTLVTTFGRCRGPVPIFTPDLDTARRSAASLLAMEPREILPGHGPPVAGSAFAPLRARLQHLAPDHPAAQHAAAHGAGPAPANHQPKEVSHGSYQ